MSKVKVIFHIGAGKTGSSSIQKTLKENQEILLEQGIVYAGLNFELICNESWNTQPWGFNQLSPAELKECYLNKINSVTINDSVKTIILSNEGFLENSSRLLNLYKYLSSNENYDLELYAYVREPESWLISGYQQWGIKHKHYHGVIKNASEYINSNPYKIITEPLAFLEQSGMKDFLTVTSIEYAGNVVKDFLGKLNVTNLLEFKENESLSERDKCLTYFYNNSFSRPVLPNESKKLIDLVNSYDDLGVINTTSIYQDTFDEEVINKEKSKLNCFLPEKQHYSSGINIKSDINNITDPNLIKLTQCLVDNYLIVKHLNPSLLRDIAISLENVDVKYARYIMSLAKLVRPNGPAINEKIAEYNNILNTINDGDL